MKAIQVQIEPNLHAHRCENCFRNGVTTVWVHDNSHGGGDASCVKVAASHTCPKCGANEWKKWLLPTAQLPNQKPQQPFVNFVSLAEVESILSIAFWFAAILVLAYMVYVRFGSKTNTGAM